MKVLIIEDEPISSRRLKRMLMELEPELITEGPAATISEVENILATKGQMRVSDCDKGVELREQIRQLEMLIAAFECGLIKENNRYRMVKVPLNNR